ncbi:GNAT family N-acetyltransferase [Gammaproteobacteria bacterium]|nr:GNAT family N-acetyltransferase [Gammaproteobacteria bacterium]
MKKSPTIRKANLSDADPIQKCVEAAYRPYIAQIGKPPGPMLDNYSEVIEHNVVFVAELDKVIGVLVLVQTQTNILLDNVAVHPTQQGIGLGRRFMELAESEASERGFEKLDLYSHECMKNNIEFYQVLGYRETERKEVRGYNRVYMQKILS